MGPSSSLNIGMKNLADVWNGFKDIRDAKSILEVKRVAKRLSELLPI